MEVYRWENHQKLERLAVNNHGFDGYNIWLVSTLKHISQLGSLFPIDGRINIFQTTNQICYSNPQYRTHRSSHRWPHQRCSEELETYVSGGDQEKRVMIQTRDPQKTIGKPQENHRNTIGKWWFNGI